MGPLIPDRLLYAVGDIHGRADLLELMLEAIAADAGTAEGDLVFLGDYIDRGPDSAAVLERLRGLQVGNLDVTCLMGNHERMLLSFLDDPLQGQMWLRYGGLETTSDFVLTRAALETGATPMETLRDRLEEAIAPDLLNWLRGLPLSFLSGNAGCLHGMADPNVSWESQSESVLLWARPARGSTPRADGIWVIHGHTVVATAERDAGRICVDTGAYKSGVLSAARCERGDIRFLSVVGQTQ